MNELDIDKLGDIYQKLKGSIFLRLVPKGRRFEGYEVKLTISDPENEENWICLLDRDLTFKEWLKVKGVIY